MPVARKVWQLISVLIPPQALAGESSAKHRTGVRNCRSARGPAPSRAEEWSFAVFCDCRCGDVLLQIAIKIMVRRHLVLLTALLVKPHPAAPSLHKGVFHLHRNRRTNPGEGVDHKANQRSISQAGKGTDIDRIDQSPRFVGLKDRSLATSLRVLRPAHGVGRVRGYDLADDHPIEEHSQSGQPQLYRGLGMELELRLDERRDVDRLYLSQIPDAVLGTESGRTAGRPPGRLGGCWGCGCGS